MKINAKNLSPFGGRDGVLGKIFRAFKGHKRGYWEFLVRVPVLVRDVRATKLRDLRNILGDHSRYSEFLDELQAIYLPIQQFSCSPSSASPSASVSRLHPPLDQQSNLARSVFPHPRCLLCSNPPDWIATPKKPLKDEFVPCVIANKCDRG